MIGSISARWSVALMAWHMVACNHVQSWPAVTTTDTVALQQTHGPPYHHHRGHPAPFGCSLMRIRSSFQAVTCQASQLLQDFEILFWLLLLKVERSMNDRVALFCRTMWQRKLPTSAANSTMQEGHLPTPIFPRPAQRSGLSAGSCMYDDEPAVL